MSDFDEVRNRIERETEKKYPGYRGPRWGEWTPARPSFLDNPLCTCNGSFDEVNRDWHHHPSCPAFGDDRAWEDTSVETTVPGVGPVKFIGKKPGDSEGGTNK
jgi:hypothetical protein